MPDDTSPRSGGRPWESGWAPDTTRAPGTRRLWLAGALAVATVVACVTAVSVTDGGSAGTRAASPASATPASGPGLISFATPSQTPPKGRSGLVPETGRPGTPRGRDSDTSERAGSPSAAAGSPTPTKPPATSWRSVRSVNYPDRSWRVSGGLVRLDPVGTEPGRRPQTRFRQVPGLADTSCVSFATADGRYLRHRDFVLREEPEDGSALFRQDATFCPRASPAGAGAVMLESVNYPGRFLRHRDFLLRLDPYRRGGLYRADSAFRLVDEAA